jgi:hypothetical protein
MAPVNAQRRQHASHLIHTRLPQVSVVIEGDAIQKGLDVCCELVVHAAAADGLHNG